ncbi:MAG: phage tail protein [Candidatus Absconditabacteria bacterium]
MRKIIEGIKQGIGIIFVLSIFIFGFYLVKGWNGLQATDGDTLTAAKWNELVSSSSSAPSGAVMAFNLTNCPTGRKPADGTNGTPDLRGTFVRGIGGEFNGRDVSRILSSYQEDSFQGHWHKSMYSINRNINSTYDTRLSNSTENSLDLDKVRSPVTDGVNGEPRIGNETRPKNVALLYCIKE